jgi:hypothetical protein
MCSLHRPGLLSDANLSQMTLGRHIASLPALRFLCSVHLPSFVAVFKVLSPILAKLQLIMSFACAGIAIWLYPILSKHNKFLALGAVGFRIIENVFQIIAALGLLLLLTLSQEAVKADALTASTFQIAGSLLLAVRFWAGLELAQIGFGLGALMYYYVFYQSKLIPRWLSAWGLIAITLQLVGVFLAVFGQIDVFSGSPILLLSAPIFFQEIVLAVWLIVKGFNPSAIASGAAKTAAN